MDTPSNKVQCACNLYVLQKNIEKHKESKTHKLLLARISKKYYEYLQYKDSSNACSQCYASFVSDDRFIKEKNICLCCDLLAKGGQNECRACKQVKMISCFVRPRLLFCKECELQRLSKIVPCDICKQEMKLCDRSKHYIRKHGA